MERTEAQVINATFFKRNKLLDNINDLGGIEDLFYRGTVNHGVKIFKKIPPNPPEGGLFQILLNNAIFTNMTMKKLVILTGAGMSSESGIRTFREAGGLWEEYDVTEVASPTGWWKNRDLVLRFYNERRSQLAACEPNEGHKGVAELEKYFDIHVITQNIDNLHEQAGSTKVLHLHGELTKARSTADPSLIYEIGYKEIKPGDTCEKGSQLRPHIVWFGEAVPMMEEAVQITSAADIFVVIGSSLNVYPAASLLEYAPRNASLWLIDPNEVVIPAYRKVEVIREKASEGVRILTGKLVQGRHEI